MSEDENEVFIARRAPLRRGEGEDEAKLHRLPSPTSMHFKLKGTLKESVYSLMRQAGYSFQGKDENSEELSFTRPPRGYPRFHLFFKQQDDNLSFSLHLDQKRPVYQGVTAHSGEYGDEIVEKEAENIKMLFQKAI